ncbi:hypothetical protein [Empedobacter falsenii]|uniref:hypothetical protein n=1 Tax=Empedobacter falsenii TaxID=343874 RepID=UPI0015DFEEF6|nr:hypothetical protein [Empedobacter falsenii]
MLKENLENVEFVRNPFLNGNFSKLEIDSNVDLKAILKEEVEISQGELEGSQEKEEITTEEVTFEIPDDGKFPQEVFDLAPDVKTFIRNLYRAREGYRSPLKFNTS